MIADTHPDGSTRGLIQLPADVKEMPLGPSGLLQVARTLHNGSLHQGVVQVPRLEQRLRARFMAYMQESEQIVTVIAVGCHLVERRGRRRGRLHGAAPPRGRRGPAHGHDRAPEGLRGHRPAPRARARDPRRRSSPRRSTACRTRRSANATVRFGCRCSPERLAQSLASLPRADIESLMEGGKPLEIECDYCRKHYEFTLAAAEEPPRPAN